jgi:hypothetical protein
MPQRRMAMRDRLTRTAEVTDVVVETTQGPHGAGVFALGVKTDAQSIRL